MTNPAQQQGNSVESVLVLKTRAVTIAKRAKPSAKILSDVVGRGCSFCTMGEPGLARDRGDSRYQLHRGLDFRDGAVGASGDVAVYGWGD